MSLFGSGVFADAIKMKSLGWVPIQHYHVLIRRDKHHVTTETEIGLIELQGKQVTQGLKSTTRNEAEARKDFS